MSAKKGTFKIMWALVILLTMSMTTLAASENDPPLIHSGKRHILDGELDQAIINFSEHLKLHGFSRDAYYWRAHCLILMDFTNEALEDLKLILNYHPKDSKVMDAIGYAYNQRGQYLEAINWFNKAIVHDERNAIIYNNRGMSYYYLDKYPTAFYDFNKAVHLDSTFAQAYSNRGSARYNNQNIAAASEIDLRKAESDYSKAIELDISLLSAYRNRGIIRFHLKKYSDSFLDLQKAIYLNPEDPIIYHHMANLMMAREQYNEAITYFNESLKRNFKLTESMYNRALSYIQLDNLELARYDYETIIENHPAERGLSSYLIARTYAMENDRKQAHQYLKLAKKYGYFKIEGNKSKVTNDVLFKDYWEDHEFAKFLEKISKN